MSLQDFLRYLGAHRDQPAFLQPETWSLLHTPPFGGNYAMGWIVQDYRGIKILSHSGWIDGFRVQLALVPEKKIGFAILANLHGTRMNLALGNRLLDLLGGGGEPGEVEGDGEGEGHPD